MEGELLGIGRTWWGFLIIVALVTVFFLMGKIDQASWQDTLTLAFTVAGGKSGLQAIAATLTKKTAETPKVEGEK